MTKDDDFGLPLEYQIKPEFFDAHNVREDTERKNASLLKFLAEHSVDTVLDMTCGTGSQVFYLHEKGYDVVGSDFSPELLNIARKKAAKLAAPINFVDGDMRNIQVGKFDAVITMFNAIGHVSKRDFAKVLNNVRGNLKPNGIYVFDIFNLEAMDEEAIENLAVSEQHSIDGLRVFQQQSSQIDFENGQMKSTDHYVIEHDDGEIEECENSFTLQIYNAAEIQDLLSANGFELISHYALDGSKFDPVMSAEILTLARACN